MNTIVLGIGVAAFIIYSLFQIMYLLSLRKAAERFDAFLRNTEGNLNETLSELKGTLENARKVTADVRSVTADVREIADTVVSLERGVQNAYQEMKESLGTAAEANIAGLKAGIKTGVVTLVRSMQQERSDDHEGGVEQKRE